MAQIHVRIPDQIKANGNEMLTRLGKTPSSYIKENYRKLVNENIKIKKRRSASSNRNEIKELKSELFYQVNCKNSYV